MKFMTNSMTEMTMTRDAAVGEDLGFGPDDASTRLKV